jgi:hypothetical protein
MELTPAFLLRMVRETIMAPRAGAAAVLNMGFSAAFGWLALMLMAVASTLLTHISFAMMPQEAQDFWGAAMASPIRTAMLQWLVLLVSVHVIHKIGRWRGGVGSLTGAVMLVAWLQFILLCLQVAQLALEIVLPAAASMLGALGLVLFLWLLTNFIAELHQFRSLGMVFFGIILTLFALSFVLAFVFGLLLGGAPVGA